MLDKSKSNLRKPITILKIGECIFTKKPMTISTVLGSCVAATFYHPPTRFSAMFHAILPQRKDSIGKRSQCSYVDSAVQGILERYKRRGIAFSELKVRLFGGAYTLQPGSEELQQSLDVGDRNIRVAKMKLAQHQIKIIDENIYSDKGRNLYLDTVTGQARVTYLESN